MARLTVAGTDASVELAPGETILAGLFRAGYAYRVGCRRGGCGVCKVRLVAGEVAYSVVVCEDVLSRQERIGGTCLSCRAVPVTDTVIALRDGERLRCVVPFLVASLTPRTPRAPAPGKGGKI